ncbi:MAG TPA: Imm51 family immunity protein [Anaerolineales bacterium]|jgi:hypothetical protein|nr:Imm51 family immunity protein [Anaerolineales bacterium]
MTDSDKSTYAPFILMTGEYQSLILSDEHMESRLNIFEERADEGWEGNGYDWTSIARVVIDEKLPDLKDKFEFDPEAGMFSASGPLDALKRLGEEMKKVFDDEDLLRDVLSRAELD